MILTGLLHKNEFIYSIHRHDFAASKDGEVAIDGGQGEGYIRLSGVNPLNVNVRVPYTYDYLLNFYNKYGRKKVIKVKELEILSEITEDLAKEYADGLMVWRTYGKNGKSKGIYKQIDELKTEHLEDILNNCFISDKVKIRIEEILKERKEHEAK